MRTHPKYLQILFFFVFFFCLWGCTTANRVSVRYEPRGKPSFIIPRDKSLNLSLGPVRGHDSGLWYQIGDYSWALEKPREQIVYEALARELERMNISVSKNSPRAKKQQGRIAVDIRWFAPYGYYPLSAAVFLSLSLYPKDAREPVWRGKFQAGTFYQASFLTPYLKKVLMEEAASEALYKAVRQLSWNWDFVRALKDLAIDNSIKGPLDHGSDS